MLPYNPHQIRLSALFPALEEWDSGGPLYLSVQAYACNPLFHKEFLLRLRHMIKNRDTVPLSEAMTWCKAQRRGAAEGTPRHATYTLLIQTLEHIAHAHDVIDLPALKFRRLAAKARELSGWSAARPRSQPVEPVPDGYRYCPRCEAAKPEKAFLIRATDRQRAAFNWGPRRAVRWLFNPYCQTCRTRKLQRQRRKTKVKQMEAVPHLKMQVWLKQAVYATRKQARAATNHHAQTFYETKLQALNRAMNALNHLLDTDPDKPIPSASDWTRLLEENHRQTLMHLHHQLIMQRLPGRSPTL